MKKPGQNDCKPHIVLRWSDNCNNRCVICSGGYGVRRRESETFAGISRKLAAARASYDAVEFSGGETTSRRRLPELVALAKKLGFTRVGISTNGRRLSDPGYCGELASAGLSYATVALHGWDDASHDAVTGVKGAFGELTRGLGNLAACGIWADAGSVLCAPNASGFERIGGVLKRYGVNRWSVSDLVPSGRGLKNYRELCVEPPALKRAVARACRELSGFSWGAFHNFSRCMLPRELPSNAVFFDIPRRLSSFRMKNIERRYSGRGKTLSDYHKSPLSVCSKCKARGACGGFWREYAAVYGEAALAAAFRPVPGA